MNRITVDVFDPDSIQFAVDMLKGMKGSIDNRAEQMIYELTDLGVTEARRSYATASFDKDEYDYGITVEPVKGERESHIIARGDQVAFREFGTGAKYGYGHPMPYLEDGTSMDIGTWSMSERGAGHWNDPNGWTYKSVTGQLIKSYGHRPAKGMYNAMMYILTNADRVAQKIFK